MEKFPKARVTDIVVSEYRDEFLIYDLKSHKCHSLNATACSVWKKSNGKRTVEQIALEIDEDSDREIREGLVLLALSELTKRNLVDSAERPVYGWLERREMIKKIGVASVIALPLVLSVTAPTAAMAQSMNCTTAPLSPGCVALTCNGGGPLATVLNQCQTTLCAVSGAPTCASGNASTPACVPNATNPGPDQFSCDCICD